MTLPSFKAKWNYPTTVWFGTGRASELPDGCRQLGMRKPLLVTDKGLAGADIVARVREHLRSGGLPDTMFSDVQGNPTGENVEAGVAAFRAGAHDGIVAMGGGSALDAAKAIALMVGQERPLWDFEDVGDNWLRVKTEGMVPVIAVPTTAGTGSEVGRASLITRTTTHEKKIIFHPRMLPALVIGDPELTYGLPPHLTAATGIDAFIHSFEAYCAPGFHPMADGIAVEGMRLVKEELPKAFANGRNVEARARLLAGSMMGAVAFQKGLGGIHALSHPIGAIFDTHHGLANAVLWPYVVVHNQDVIAPRIPYLAAILGLAPTFDAFLAWVLDFRKSLGIPHSLAELKLDPERASEVGRMAEADPSSGSNPKPIDARTYAEIYRRAYRGILA